jgi:hypothetical protein
MFRKLFFALVVLSLSLAGCSAASRDFTSTGSSSMEAPAVAPNAMPEAQRADAGSSFDKSAYSLDQSAASADRLVIKNANLSITVDDPLKSMDNISKLADSMGGFVVKADMYQQTLSNGTKVPLVSMTIRVPVDKLNDAMAAIKAETNQPIVSENVTSEDVTAQYTDLNSKLVNLEAAEKQLQEIMGSATKTEDVLAVYAQLVSTREQIEVIKGQMKYYEQSAALSAISVQLTANAAVQPVSIAGWQPKGVAKEALQSLLHAVQSLANFGIRAALLYIPVMLLIFGPIALIIWGIVALVRRGRRGRKTPVVTPQA